MNKNNPGRDIFTLLGGLAMLGIGLYWLMQSVDVSTSFFSGGVRIMNQNLSSGAVIIPFIIGIVMVFVKPDSILAKGVCVVGVFIIIFSIILSTRITLHTMSMYEWVLMLILIFGGTGMTARILFGTSGN